MSNVRALPGCKAPTKRPNEAMVKLCRDLLAMAESGELQSFVGTGFTSDGLRWTMWCDEEPDIFKMRGAIAWLESEYVERHIEALDE